jgi:CubicO group peptidase (beta-lactamase class C family)
MKKMIAFLIAALLPLSSAQSGESLPPQANDFASTVVVEFNTKKITKIYVQGFADPFSKRRVTADDPVRVASVSKLVVALGVHALATEGKISLDRDVSDYLGWSFRNPHFPDKVITLAMLLNHTSSVMDDMGYLIPLGEKLNTLMADPKAWDAVHAPGSWFRYANLNFPVIGSVMEKASGERFDRLMQRLIFKPMKMDACYNWSTCSDAKVKRAVVLTHVDGKVRKDDLKGVRPPCLGVNMVTDACTLDAYQLGDNGALFSPQGGLRISMRDLARIGQMLLKTFPADNQGFRQQLAAPKAMLTGDSEGGFFCFYKTAVQSLGWVRHSDCHDEPFGDGRIRFGHAGEAYGLRSGLWVDPIAGTGVAFFTTAVPDDVAKGPKSAFTAREESLLQGRFVRPGK